AELELDPACQPLFGRGESAAARGQGDDCQALEAATSLGDKLAHAGSSQHSSDPAEIARDQTRRAENLFACLCRGGRCSPPARPLDDGQYAALVQRLLAD